MTEESENTNPFDGETDLHELIMRGSAYRESREFEYLGQTIEVIMGPIEDVYNIPLTAALHAQFDLDVEEAREEVEEARDDDGSVDITKLDEAFVGIMQRAARYSIDQKANGWDDAQFNDIVGSDPTDPEAVVHNPRTINGMIVDLGMAGMELGGSLEDAQKFPGRGTR